MNKIEQKTPNPKCSTCKCYWKPDENDIKTSGLVYKICRKCRNYKLILKERKQVNKEAVEVKCI